MDVVYDYWCFFFFQAEDGIRDAQESRGLGMCIRDRTTGVSSSEGPGIRKTSQMCLPTSLWGPSGASFLPLDGEFVSANFSLVD